MAGRRASVGRLRKHIKGWDAANKRIFILNKTYEQWGQLKQLKNFRNDDAVAQYLLSCHALLSGQQQELTQEE